MAAKRRKPHSSASAAPQPSAPQPHSMVPRPAAAPALHTDASTYEVRAAAPRIFDASDDLLSRARMQWQFGEWPSLLHLDLLAIEHHPARAELALLSSCAALQMGQPETAQRYLTAAESWDCHPALMARLLLAGVSNSLARYHALKGHSATSETYFLEAASALGGDPRLAARARQQQELLSLPPLLPSSRHSLDQAPLAPPAPAPSSPTASAAASSGSCTPLSEPAEHEANPFQPGIGFYAKNCEDVMLWRALSHVEDGFYIDVGARHPVQGSVSKAFYEKGWRGIHVEATPAYARLLRQDRPESTVLEAALSNHHGTLRFFEIPETGLSTGDPANAARYQQQGFEVRETSVPTLTLADVFALAGDREIHWLKIDVEGMEEQVLEGWGHSAKRPWVILVKTSLSGDFIKKNPPWEKPFLARNYIKTFDNKMGLIYVCSEAKMKRLLQNTASRPTDITPETNSAHTSTPALQADHGALKDHDSLNLLSKTHSNLQQELYRLAAAAPENSSLLSIFASKLDILGEELTLENKRRRAATKIQAPTLISSPLDEPEDSHPQLLETLSCSQLGQDIWVLRMTNFKRGGFFVDFGATDGIRLNNTYLLENSFDWKGICAEPNPTFFHQLKNNRRCTVSDECIGEHSGEIVAFILADEFGGIRKYAHDGNDSRRQGYIDKDLIAEMRTISLDEFLRKHGSPKAIDYLSIDTEGSEYVILSSFPFDSWDIRLITIEHNFTERRIDIQNLLTSQGFKLKQSQFEDWYYKV